MQFLQHPGIPSGPVRLAALGSGQAALCAALERRGIHPMVLKEDSRLPKGLSNHADLLLFHLCEHIFYTVQDNILIESANITQIRNLVGKYPGDVPLNLLTLPGMLICNTKTAAPEILTEAERQGFEIIHVNQGYTRCSTAVIGKRAVITADSGIAKTLAMHAVDVLCISEHGVDLKGYSCGFIGGACALLHKNELCFMGTLDSHPDADSIRAFLKQYAITATDLWNGPLTDVGGIIPILQEEITQ